MGMPSGPFSFVEYYTSQAEYMALLNSLMLSANKSVTLGVGDNSWMDVNVWTKVMGTFWTNFEKKLADPAYLDERSVFKGLNHSRVFALCFLYARRKIIIMEWPCPSVRSQLLVNAIYLDISCTLCRILLLNAIS